MPRYFIKDQAKIGKYDDISDDEDINKKDSIDKIHLTTKKIVYSDDEEKKPEVICLSSSDEEDSDKEDSDEEDSDEEDSDEEDCDEEDSDEEDSDEDSGDCMEIDDNKVDYASFSHAIDVIKKFIKPKKLSYKLFKATEYTPEMYTLESTLKMRVLSVIESKENFEKLSFENTKSKVKRLTK